MTTKLYLGWDEFYSHAKVLATKIKESGIPYSKIIAVSRGGLIPAGILSYELGIRHCETITIASYDEAVKRAEEDIEVINHIENIDENTLVIDDISDSGRTFRILRRLYPQACYATVYVKEKGKDATDIFAKLLPDNWVVFPWDNI